VPGKMAAHAFSEPGLGWGCTPPYPTHGRPRLWLAPVPQSLFRLTMLTLTDKQLKLVMTAAQPLDPDKRALLLERVAAQLQFAVGGARPRDDDIEAACRRSLEGLLQGAA